MGNIHNTNLRINCTSYNGDANNTRVNFRDGGVLMGYKKENDNTDEWNACYYIGKKIGHNFYNTLKARHDENGVNNIHFGFGDYGETNVNVSLNITRIGRDGLQEEITGARSPNAYYTFVSDKQDYLIVTTLISCNSPDRGNLLVLQMKKMNHSDIAYMATIAHYYVVETIGLYVEAMIFHNKDKGFVVEVNGPFKYPSVYLHKVMDETRRTGNWSAEGKPSNKIEDLNLSVHSDNIIVDQIVKHASNKGLINSNGYTNGSLNNSIFCSIM